MSKKRNQSSLSAKFLFTLMDVINTRIYARVICFSTDEDTYYAMLSKKYFQNRYNKRRFFVIYFFTVCKTKVRDFAEKINKNALVTNRQEFIMELKNFAQLKLIFCSLKLYSVAFN